MSERLPHYVAKAMTRLQGGAVLVCQASDAEEAILRGNGHLYFTHPDGRAFPTASGRFLIERRMVEPAGDDLFPDGSQTYRLAEVAGE